MRNATRIIASTFGLLAGLAGLEHGIGETLQGNRAPGGVMIASLLPQWRQGSMLPMTGGVPISLYRRSAVW